MSAASGQDLPQLVPEREAAAPAATAPSAAAPATQATSRGARETWLRVTKDDVNIRARPDTASVVVARAVRGALLHARGCDDYGWYRIEPPEGVFSYVSKEHVRRSGVAEGVVEIRSGTLRVRVGSTVRELDPVQSEVQALLERGARVQIVGEQGEWLKIAPPAGVHVYISGDVVETLSDELAGHLVALRKAADGSPAGVARAGAPPATGPAPSPRQAGPDLSGRWGERLVEVEKLIAAEDAKPLGEQRWAEAIARLRPIAEQREELLVAQLALGWIAQLEQRVADQRLVREGHAILARTERDQGRHEREMQRIGRTREIASQPAFAAQGELLPSYAAGSGARRRYQLVNPVNRRLEAYVEAEPQAGVDLAGLVGQYVGVRGTRRSVPGLGADLVEAAEVVALRPQRADTQPARQGR
ncbi:MAG: SH3 domain-containing protein [Planctomycetota bacterium]